MHTKGLIASTKDAMSTANDEVCLLIAHLNSIKATNALLLGTLHEIVGNYHLGGTINEAARLATETINKAKSHADTLKGDSVDDLVAGLERACDLHDDIQERKAKGD